MYMYVGFFTFLTQILAISSVYTLPVPNSPRAKERGRPDSSKCSSYNCLLNKAKVEPKYNNSKDFVPEWQLWREDTKMTPKDGKSSFFDCEDFTGMYLNYDRWTSLFVIFQLCDMFKVLLPVRFAGQTMHV